VIASTWPWVLLGLVLFPLVGLLLMLVLGVFGAPGDALRRLWQRVTLRRPVEGGVELPDEVPDDRTGG
jgi:hypothetical protein